MAKIVTKLNNGKSATTFRNQSVHNLNSKVHLNHNLSDSDDNNNYLPVAVKSDKKDNQSLKYETYLEMEGLLKINKKSYALVYQHELPVLKCPSTAEMRQKYERQHEDNVIRKRKRSALTMCINTRYEVIPKTAKSVGYRLVREHDQWNLCWTDSIVSVEFCREMRRYQKINHFPGMFEICRKDLLARNLNRMAKLFPLDYQIFPKTWCFPADLGDAISYSRQHKNKTYILKPDQGSQGKGIWLTKSLKDIKPNERMICQVYVNKPLLIDGYKFDLRVYTLVTSTDPLRIFVYNEGLARFATSKYREPSGNNTQNMFMHLTNYSVNKHSRTFSTDDEAGSKRKFSTLNRILAEENYDIVELWANIDDIIVKTVLSAWPMLRHNYIASFPSHDVTQACFEILGIDILIDQNMKPYVLEVNHSPSFHTTEHVDKEVKGALIRDTLILLNLSSDIKKRVLDEDKRRVKNRLLNKIKPELNNCSSATAMEKSLAWTEQMSWEESHLGSYRRICPPPGDPNKYLPFFVLQSQASVYSETASSKRREEYAKKQRCELEEKNRYSNSFLNGHVVAKSQLRPSRLYGEDDEKPWTNKKQRWGAAVARDQYEEVPIGENQERERISLLAQRDFLIRSSGLLQAIYMNFYRNRLLTETDRNKYSKLFAKLLSPNDSTTKQLPQLSPNEQRQLELKGIDSVVANKSNWARLGQANQASLLAAKLPQLVGYERSSKTATTHKQATFHRFM